MTIEEKLKKKILDEFKSIRAFTQTANIPYSTIDTMLKKGIQGTGISTMIKVCTILSIDINELCSGEIVDKHKKIDLNEDILKEEGIKLYKRLDTEDKAEIRGEMKGMLKADKYNQPTSEDDEEYIYIPIAARGGGVSQHKVLKKTHEEFLKNHPEFNEEPKGMGFE